MYVQYPKGNRELNRWYFTFSYQDDFVRMQPMVKRVWISLAKIVKRPPEGVELPRGYYKGFIFSFSLLVPFRVERWR
jgi:hypothetical protein